MASVATAITPQVSQDSPENRLSWNDGRQHDIFGNSLPREDVRPKKPPPWDRPDPQVKNLERQLARCGVKLAEMSAITGENADLKIRLQRLRRLKSNAEEQLLALKSKQRAMSRISVMQIRDHQNYAASCLRLYELALDQIQKLLKTTHAGQRWMTHKCPDCGPQPIHEFGVRILPSGYLGFAPYCLACIKLRKENARKVLEMDVKEVAAEFADRTPKVAKQLVERFEEAVEELMNEQREDDK